MKSDAYGFGLERIFTLAWDLGFRKYAVIRLEDAIFIKKHNKEARVLLMGVFNPKKIFLYQRYRIEITINDYNECFLVGKLPLVVQIAVNTGMNRFGVRLNDFQKVYESLKNSRVSISGIYTHLGQDSALQLAGFNHITQNLLLEKHYAATKHLPSENARIGAGIYENALTVYGNIIKINYVYKNEYIGYGTNYQMQADGYIGVIDLGYADGLIRKCAGFKVYINGNFYPLVAMACMNHSFVLLPNESFLGLKVEFVGENNIIMNYAKHFDVIIHQIYTAFLKK